MVDESGASISTEDDGISGAKDTAGASRSIMSSLCRVDDVAPPITSFGTSSSRPHEDGGLSSTLILGVYRISLILDVFSSNTVS